jgi:hypothetical protein
VKDIPNWRNANLLTIPHPRTELFRRAPMYFLPTLWTALDETELKHCRTTFRISLKEKLINEPE